MKCMLADIASGMNTRTVDIASVSAAYFSVVCVASRRVWNLRFPVSMTGCFSKICFIRAKSNLYMAHVLSHKRTLCNQRLPIYDGIPTILWFWTRWILRCYKLPFACHTISETIEICEVILREVQFVSDGFCKSEVTSSIWEDWSIREYVHSKKWHALYYSNC